MDSDLSRAGRFPGSLDRTLTRIVRSVPRAHARSPHSHPIQPSVARIIAPYGGASAVEFDHTSLFPAPLRGTPDLVQEVPEPRRGLPAPLRAPSTP